MIYTITFNPSLDYIVRVDDFQLGETNRSSYEEMFAGGKGINVSTILTQLGYDNIALGFVAGFTGMEIEKRITATGLKSDFIHLKNGISRINVKLKSGQETEINGLGPTIEKDELAQLYKKIEQLKQDDWLILAGSIPNTLPNDMYQVLMEKVQDKGIRVIVDATNDLLVKVLTYHPFLIKPNHRELEEIFQVQIHSEEELIAYGKKLQGMGAQNVLISRAEKGAILLSSGQSVYRCLAAKGTVKNSVGAGDSMVAGFLAGYLKHQKYEEALCLGSAAGGASAFHDGLATANMIEEVYQTISWEELK